MRAGQLRGPSAFQAGRTRVGLLPNLPPPARRRAMFRLVDVGVLADNHVAACTWMRRLRPVV